MPNVDIPQGIDTGGSTRRQETMRGTRAQTRSKRVLEQPNEPPLLEGHTSRSREGRMEHTFKLTNSVPPTPHDSPLTGDYTPGSDKGWLKLLELINICTTLLNKGWMIREIDKDKNVNLVSEQGEVHETVEPLKDDDDATLAETLMNIKRSTTKDKEKANETARQEQEKYNLKKALKLQKLLDQREEDVDKADQTQDIDWNDREVLRYHALQYRVFSKAEDFEITKEVMKRSGFNLQQESLKKQKLDEQTEEEVEAQADTDQEIEEMKLYMKIVPDEEIEIDAIPLATKPLVIVEYKIVKEGKISTYHVIRADESTK
nr:hypothetical protein [Tanacetum cinerariifolium]